MKRSKGKGKACTKDCQDDVDEEYHNLREKHQEESSVNHPNYRYILPNPYSSASAVDTRAW